MIPQFIYFRPILCFSSFFYCSFLTAWCGDIFFNAIMAKTGHSSASYASFLFPFQGLTTIVFLLFNPCWELVSIIITELIFLPKRVKSFPLKLLLWINKKLLYPNDSCITCALYVFSCLTEKQDGWLQQAWRLKSKQSRNTGSFHQESTRRKGETIVLPFCFLCKNIRWCQRLECTSQIIVLEGMGRGQQTKKAPVLSYWRPTYKTQRIIEQQQTVLLHGEFCSPSEVSLDFTKLGCLPLKFCWFLHSSFHYCFLSSRTPCWKIFPYVFPWGVIQHFSNYLPLGLRA